MLIKLPNGDLVDSEDIVSVRALEAVFIPDRVEVELSSGSVVEVEAVDIEDAERLRDQVVGAMDATGSVMLDLTDDVGDTEAEGDAASADEGGGATHCDRGSDRVQCVFSEPVAGRQARAIDPGLPRTGEDPLDYTRRTGNPAVVGCSDPDCPCGGGVRLMIIPLPD